MAPISNPHWPILRRYDGQHLARIAMPLGGIGTGSVSLGGRGQLQDWEIVNRPAKGFAGGEAFFALYVRPEGGEPVTRVLEGALLPPYEGAFGATAAYHGLPRFRECSFGVAYPLAQVLLSDPDVPLAVRLETLNPFVPADADASGIPVAVLRYVLQNEGDVPVAASVCGTLKNFVGTDGASGCASQNVNEFRDEGPIRGLFMRSEGVAPSAEQWGTLALVTTAPEASYLRAWSGEKWHGDLLSFWDDLSGDGRLEDRDAPAQDAPIGSLAAPVVVPPHGEAAVTFLLTWHFPNRQTWTPCTGAAGDDTCCCTAADRIGNYYTTQYRDAWEVAQRTAAQLALLEERTVRFVRAFCGSALPEAVKEAALANLSTLCTQTCFRTEDGRFYGWEGCCDDRGCCHGSCTHVWNYEQATAHLFGDLARSMREVEFLHATTDEGHMSFRVHLPLERAQEHGIAAADGQMGAIIKVYREWQLSGDDAWLRTLWPKVRRALEFAWIPGGWDADQDGVMEGCQHNTLDVEYYGPNPLMACWYLGALRAAEEIARRMDDEPFAARCQELFQRGHQWVDANLFNGEYYEQQVRPSASAESIAPGLRHPRMGAEDLADPDFQVGPGCLVDQLVGQVVAHVCGLGHLLDPGHVRSALGSILRHNGRQELYGHFNPMRTFALNDERALLMCSFPRGGRPRKPVPYYAEVMTGFEYAAAAHMLYEGMIEEGLECIANIRARYDGRKRNPFDEAECGHHYARAMASWGAVLALTGFHYSAVDASMAFAPQRGEHFWSTGYAWGTCSISPGDACTPVRIRVLHGQLPLRKVVLTGYGEVELIGVLTIAEGCSMVLTVEQGGCGRIVG